MLEERSITTITTSDYYPFHSQGKEGVFRLYSQYQGELLLNDTGVVVLVGSNHALVSGWLQLNCKPKFLTSHDDN